MKNIIKISGLGLVVLVSVANAKSFDEEAARAELAAHIDQKSEIQQDFYNQLFERELFKGTFRNNRWRFNVIRWMDLVYETELGEKRLVYLLDGNTYSYNKAKAQYPEEMAALEKGVTIEEVTAMADEASANGQAAKYRFFKRYLPNAEEYLVLRRYNDAGVEFSDLVYLEKKVSEILHSNSDFKFHGASNQEKGQALDDEKLYEYYYNRGKEHGPPNGELFGRSEEVFADYFATYLTAMSKDQYSVSLNDLNRAQRTIQENWTRAEGDPAKLPSYKPSGAVNLVTETQSVSSGTSISAEGSEPAPTQNPKDALEDKVDEAVDSVIEKPKEKLKKIFGF